MFYNCKLKLQIDIFLLVVGLYAKLEKCGFHQTEVEFFKYTIFGNCIYMDLCKAQTIMDCITIVFVHDVQSFF